MKKPRRLLRRRPATIDQAVTVATRGRALAGSSALVVGTRVGSADFVPRGYELADCTECGHSLWVNPEVVEAIERQGMRLLPLCIPCSGLPEGGLQ
jgi:predicted amidohydrolase